MLCEPVTTTRSHAAISAWVIALSTGAGSTCTRSAGAPIFWSSVRISATAWVVVARPPGDGAMTIALRPLSAIIVLFTGVAAGLVDGVTAQTTPTGFAYFTRPSAGCSSMMPTLFTRIRSRRVPKVLRWS